MDSTQKQPAVVAICDVPQFPHVKVFFDRLSQALSSAGYSPVRYASSEALTAAAEAGKLADASLLAGFGSMPASKALIERAPNLRGIVSLVSGTEGIDVATATRSGILVAHAPTPENVRGMAEAAVMLMLNLMYDLDGTRATMGRDSTRPLGLSARLVKGKTIGLVGYGRISSMVVQLLSGWDVKLQVYSRRDKIDGLEPAVRQVGIDELMRTSDIVCVLAGLDSSTRGFIDADKIALMKRSAFFVNVARGSLVDEAALAAALAEGRIAGAALDVFEVEPLAADSPLRSTPNTILTPHQVGHTQDLDESIHRAASDNVFAILEGRLPPFLKNQGVVPVWLDANGGRPLAAGPVV